MRFSETAPPAVTRLRRVPRTREVTRRIFVATFPGEAARFRQGLKALFGRKGSVRLERVAVAYLPRLMDDSFFR